MFANLSDLLATMTSFYMGFIFGASFMLALIVAVARRDAKQYLDKLRAEVNAACGKPHQVFPEYRTIKRINFGC